MHLQVTPLAVSLQMHDSTKFQSSGVLASASFAVQMESLGILDGTHADPDACV